MNSEDFKLFFQENNLIRESLNSSTDIEYVIEYYDTGSGDKVEVVDILTEGEYIKSLIETNPTTLIYNNSKYSNTKIVLTIDNSII